MTNYCDFRTGAGVAKCEKCGFSLPATSGKIYRHCDKESDGTHSLSLLEKAKNFAKSAISHVSAGMPMCTEEEVIRRHDICLGCEHYQNNSCTQCGCPVKRDKLFISKLSWAGESCPVGKWGPVAKEG